MRSRTPELASARPQTGNRETRRRAPVSDHPGAGLVAESGLNALDGLEVDLSSGILTIEFPDGLRYVVNSHRAARQIWMAAERSAWHFDFVREGSRWVASKNGDELRSTLSIGLCLCFRGGECLMPRAGAISIVFEERMLRGEAFLVFIKLRRSSSCMPKSLQQ